jgi:ribosomal protein S3
MFKCAGRFSRAQMASYQVYKQGCMPLSTIKHNIKYAFGTVSLKYGSLGLKVFIFG